MLNANEYDTQHHGSHDVSDEEYRQMRSAEDDDYKPVVEKKASKAKKAESDPDDGYTYPDPTTIQGKERIKKKLKRNPNPELYKQSADKADEVISDLDIEFMPPENKKPSRNKEQQRARESQKSGAKQTKGPEMII